MAHTISERMRRQRERELAPEVVRERERITKEEAQHVIDLIAAWNERAKLGRPTSFYPTVASALAAKMPVLECFCPGCQTVGSVDLRKIDIHPKACVSALIPRLSCKRCCPNPPFAVLVGLRRAPA